MSSQVCLLQVGLSLQLFEPLFDHLLGKYLTHAMHPVLGLPGNQVWPALSGL
jgi:hypothetical protein